MYCSKANIFRLLLLTSFIGAAGAAQAQCYVPWGPTWCQRTSGNSCYITVGDFTGTRWPVGTAIYKWMNASPLNSIYLVKQSGSSINDLDYYESNNGNNNVLGITYLSATGACINRDSGGVHLNDYYSTASANWTTTHETGHGVGLLHTPSTTTNVMYPSYTGTTAKNGVLSACDAAGAAALYHY